MVLGRGLRLGAFGALIGLLVALAVTRRLAIFLYGVSPFDALTIASVPLLLGAITLVASWLPALRVINSDPMQALRNE